MVLTYYRYGYNEIVNVGNTGEGNYPTFNWNRKFSSKTTEVLSPVGAAFMNAVCPTAVSKFGWSVGVYEVLDKDCGGLWYDCAPDHQELLQFRFNGDGLGSQLELTSRNSTVGSCTEETRGATYTPCIYYNQGLYTGLFSSASVISASMASVAALVAYAVSM
tara:strand:+ start:307 stop:792 length:486 start_codon:yes stop_codon:yes gene_type:complete